MPEQRKLKIALLQSPTFPLNIDFHGGIERAEINQLDYLMMAGHDVTLFVPKLIGHKNNIKVIRDINYRSRYLQWIYYFQFLIKTTRYDVLHGHYTPQIALLRSKKSVIHFHGKAILTLPLYRYKLAIRCYQKAHYIFNSRWLLTEFSSLYPEICADNLHLIYCGCDIINKIPTPMNKKYDSFKNICWYGVWHETKGIFDLLRAIQMLEPKRKDFRVNIGGSANFEGDTIESKIIEESVRNYACNLKTVNIVGPIKHNKLPQFLIGQHIGVFNPTYREPFGLVGVEMMAAGLPVVAYNVEGPSEYITNGVNGFLVENRRPDLLAEKIEYLLDHPDRLAAMGRAAREHVEKNFTWEKHIEQLLHVYITITSRRKNG